MGIAPFRSACILPLLGLRTADSDGRLWGGENFGASGSTKDCAKALMVLAWTACAGGVGFGWPRGSGNARRDAFEEYGSLPGWAKRERGAI